MVVIFNDWLSLDGNTSIFCCWISSGISVLLLCSNCSLTIFSIFSDFSRLFDKLSPESSEINDLFVNWISDVSSAFFDSETVLFRSEFSCETVSILRSSISSPPNCLKYLINPWIIFFPSWLSRV